VDRYMVDIADIMDAVGGVLDVTDSLDLDRLVVGDEEFVYTKPVRFSVTLTNTGAGIVAMGIVHADVDAECSRCLVHFGTRLDGEVEGFYVTPAGARGIPDEQPYELIGEHTVDILPAILQALTVEAPFAPVHAEDCKGMCPACGCDRNERECGCEPERGPSAFGALRGLFEEGGTAD
jgi:uncharacterized protein